MSELFAEFPQLEDERIIIRKMAPEDVDSLAEITGNDAVYRYIPPYLYKKSRKFLLTAINNIGGRDFDRQKHIIAGIYYKPASEKLVGLAEMFDFKKRANEITLGYRLNEAYWGMGIATAAARLMIGYLAGAGVGTIKAFVMPENAASWRVLEKAGFNKLAETAQEHNWGGQEDVTLDVYEYVCGQ